MNRQFSVNLKGLIKNFNFPEEPLFPVYEAIINAIQSIDARRKKDERFKNGIIKIKLIRNGIMPTAATSAGIPPICSFEITDNGTGFKEDNMRLFMESGSIPNEKPGCKGTSRFSWIKFFEKVEVESVYFDRRAYVKRKFEFTAEQSAISETLKKLKGKRNGNSTTIKLINCIDSYAPYIPISGYAIASKIIQHCLAYFISDDCPQIYLTDGGRNNTFKLNQIFKNEFKEKNIAHIEIGKGTRRTKKPQGSQEQKESFELISTKSDMNMARGHKLHICVHNKIVRSINLNEYITDLDNEFYQKNKFWYKGILRGKYLDDNFDIYQLSFTIPEKGDTWNLSGTIAMEQIIKSACRKVKNFLKYYFTPIADKKELTRKYWKYYLMLERRFIESTEYIELHESNFKTFSNAYVTLLLAIGAEIDTFFKEFCMFDTSENRTIAEYAKYIFTNRLDLNWAIELKEYGIKVQPFDDWYLIGAPGKSLEWWMAYTNVKHNRLEQLPLANQKNVLYILGALFLLETLYLIRITEGTSESEYTFDEPSKLFTIGKLPIRYIREGARREGALTT